MGEHKEKGMKEEVNNDISIEKQDYKEIRDQEEIENKEEAMKKRNNLSLTSI